MTNVVELPDSMQRQWRVYEKMLDDFMRAHGSGAGEIAHVLRNVKPVFLQYATQNLSAPLDPADPDAVVRQLNAWVQGIVCGLLEEVVAREIRLFRAGESG